MDQYDFAGNVSGFCEVGGTATANIDHRHMLYRSERGCPSDGNTAHAELDLGNLRELRIKRGSRGADGHLGRALGPGIRDGELLGVDAVGAGSLEHLYAPVHGTLHRGCAGHAATDFVG